MSATALNEFIFKINKPCVFKNILTRDGNINSASEWTFANLTKVFANQKFAFRIGKKLNSDGKKSILFHRGNIQHILLNGVYNFKDIQFENQCDYVDATLDEFIEWKNSLNFENSAKRLKLDESGCTNPFDEYSLDENWAYADYKYMIELVDSAENKLDPNVIEVIYSVVY
jgi:hypothetical protein